MTTVSELITHLQRYDPTLLVTVDGYEGGMTAQVGVEEIKLVLADKDSENWWDGEYEEYDPETAQIPIPAVNIFRGGAL